MTKRSAESKEPVAGSVTLCIRSQKYILNGRWTWDMQSDAVYGSDVMDFPQEFEGTKGIIHPDDAQKVNSALQLLQDCEVAAFDFRLITTYGEVRTIGGKKIRLDISGKTEEVTAEKQPWEESMQAFALRKEAEYLQQRRTIADAAERFCHTGAWAINKVTGEAWYSDGMYHIHGLPPQSLNAHANTFQPFLHAGDRIPFLDAFEAAYEAEVPLHLEYRIQLTDGESRTVRMVSYWSYNSKGQPVFTGILRDMSEDAAKDEQVIAANEKLLLHQQVLKFSEQVWNTGYWFLDLVTRKATFSDNFFRLYGLKAQAKPGFKAFLDMVHPDDRERIKTLLDNLYTGHQLPEAEFRIIRPDGRQRHLKQSGRLVNVGTHLLMIGVVQDITVQRGLEKKIAELTEKALLQDVVRKVTESQTDTALITWYPKNKQTWSEN
ncbi:MAG TPA: PAS domain-containing protein, partial [Flavisolibacter sp.]|nr:PAS domain-containing protein [Flavisolibacter sp.]